MDFWQLTWYPLTVESCSPCFSPFHACNTTATSRCRILACLLFCFIFFSFHFKNSIWLACSQGSYSALQLVSAVAADKPGSFSMIYLTSALLGFSECYLNFIHVQPLIYRTTSIKLLFSTWFFQNNLLPERGKKEAITTTIGART